MSQSSNDRPNGRGGTAALAESEHHRLLSSERRRILLDVLDGRAVPVTVEEVAVEVANREDDADVENVAVTLHHVHLPKLSDWGVVSYDPASNRIESYRGLTR